MAETVSRNRDLLERMDEFAPAAQELKPCPFCGSPGAPEDCQGPGSRHHLFWAQCKGCGISGVICNTRDAAAAAWNRRAPAGTSAEGVRENGNG